jgi:hypothetical protein
METSHKQHLSEQYLKARSDAKILFKQGKIQESFEFIKTNVHGLAAKNVEDGTATALAEVLSALILEARLRQEIGEFPKADILLQELQSKLTDASTNETLG